MTRRQLVFVLLATAAASALGLALIHLTIDYLGAN